MTALITLAHGSRRGGDDTIARLAGVAGGHASFLDLQEPGLSAVARNLKNAGHSHATVVPLLFSRAYHHKVDVPAALSAAEEETGLRLTLAPSFADAHPDIADILRARIHADAPAGAVVVLYAVGSSDARANEEIIALAANVGAQIAFATGIHKGEGLPGIIAAHPGRHIHLLPLFVAEGLLLDMARGQLPPGATESQVLGTDLAPIVRRLAELAGHNSIDQISSEGEDPSTHPMEVTQL